VEGGTNAQLPSKIQGAKVRIIFEIERKKGISIWLKFICLKKILIFFQQARFYQQKCVNIADSIIMAKMKSLQGKMKFLKDILTAIHAKMYYAFFENKRYNINN
jgi:hypothetical protein